MIAIQACYEINNSNRDREVSGIHSTMLKFKILKGYIVTFDQEEEITDAIAAVPFWKLFFQRDF